MLRHITEKYEAGIANVLIEEDSIQKKNFS